VIKLSKILNISKKEWPRVMVAWSLMFLTRFGFIVGWSVLIATFLSKVGINLLPALFLANALMVMLGTTIFRKLVRKVQREVMISFTVIAAAATLLSSILFIQTNVFAFFILLLTAESILLAQLNIFLSLFNEDLFTPLESQRTFPIIESAETIGAIAGGLVLSLYATSVPSYKFIVLWAVSLILILPIVLFFNPKTLDVPKLIGVIESQPKKKKIRESISNLKKIPFLKGMMIVILLHWGMMNMVEFQYTKAIQQDVYSVQEETLISETEANGVILASQGFTEEQTLFYEQQLTQKLGTLHAIFNAAALFIQLIIASRLIQSLGVLPSMMIHPVMSLLNLLGLTLKFNFNTAVFTRGAYEMTGLIFKNSYDSTYYAIPHTMRDDAKEMMQGIMKPLGAILGTILIILVAFNFTGVKQTAIINILLVLMATAMSIIVYRLVNKYTVMSEQNLTKKMDLPTRLNSIEILSQNGHKHFTPSLLKILKRDSESEIIKETILKTLGERQDPESINAILDLIETGNDTLRLAAVKALKEFTEEDKLMERSFTAFRLVSSLKKSLEKEENETIREHLVRCFYDFSPKDLTDFLLTKIQAKSPHYYVYIRMLRLFDDANLKYYLEPFLKDRNPKVKAASIIALWQFESLRTELKHYLRQMFDSKKESTQRIAIATAGEVQFAAAKPFLKHALKSEENETVDTALISLGQLGDENVVSMIVERFADMNHPWHDQVESISKRFSKYFEENLRREMSHSVSKQISDIIAEFSHVEDMDAATLKRLRRLYHKLNAHHEAHQIKTRLASGKHR
jgi:HEAT repeat protein/ATP/ADP translocase